MPIETQISDLQASVTALLAAINIKKADLDAAVAICEGITDAALAIEEISNALELSDAVDAAAASAAAADADRVIVEAAVAAFPSRTGQALKIPRVTADETAYEHRTLAQIRADLALDTTNAVTFGSVSIGAPVVKTADFTLAATENFVINNKTGGALVVTLPDADDFVGRQVWFSTGANGQAINSATSNILALPSGSAVVSILPAGAGRWALLVSDGTNWCIVATGRASGYLDISDMVPETSLIPVGTTAQRPGSPTAGLFRYNTTLGTFEGYVAGQWLDILSYLEFLRGPDGLHITAEFDKEFTTTFSIGTNKVAVSPGPIEVPAGIFVTIPSGSRWKLI